MIHSARAAIVKICGITNPKDAEAAIEFGADALGFNFWPGSKRYIAIEAAADWVGQLPGAVLKVAVMVNPTWEEAERVFALPWIDLVQFHGEETAEFCAHFAARGLGFIKAVALKDSTSCAQVDRYAARHILLDAYAPGVFGGTGKIIDWALAAQFVQTRPDLKVLLSGGLTPENVAEAIVTVAPYGVDIASGVERAPGQKDPGLMKALIQAARAVTLPKMA